MERIQLFDRLNNSRLNSQYLMTKYEKRSNIYNLLNDILLFKNYSMYCVYFYYFFMPKRKRNPQRYNFITSKYQFNFLCTISFSFLFVISSFKQNNKYTKFFIIIFLLLCYTEQFLY